MEKTVERILNAMSSCKKPQRIFMAGLFSVLMVFQGKANFRNLSRYSEIHEKRFSRWFRRDFDFIDFNRRLIETEIPNEAKYIAAIDASFMKKSGQKTEGFGYFYNGKAGKAEKGLEISLISLIDLKANTRYALTAEQTIDDKNKTRVDLYAEQVDKASESLKALGIRHLVADSYYSKIKLINPVCEWGFDLVGKLRIDADLYWFYEGEYRGIGRPRIYDGKVNINTEKKRFHCDGVLEEGLTVYSQCVYSKHFKRKMKVVLLHWLKNGKEGHAILFSTDIELDSFTLVQYYKSRFQIEFLFRDAKQYTGLMDCQARNKKAIHTHINASLSTLNLLKIEDRKQKNTDQNTVISIASWKRKKFNEHLMLRLFDELGLSRDCEKVAKAFEVLSVYGAIAA